MLYIYKMFSVERSITRGVVLFSYHRHRRRRRRRRSVRKDSAHAERQTTQEEENEHQEMHTESLLQRVIYF